ncbi:hypothetical protein E2C01_000128 [Portunus trituberculatus]|uniref:Uncharacterized protein n=1 Tax=Portunus trituberculatus TaxID=210409 RepID=A0A5B7CFN8_PORTR|nr:hypothetical protein [Portunus trituberculatus]
MSWDERIGTSYMSEVKITNIYFAESTEEEKEEENEEEEKEEEEEEEERRKMMIRRRMEKKREQKMELRRGIGRPLVLVWRWDEDTTMETADSIRVSHQSFISASTEFAKQFTWLPRDKGCLNAGGGSGAQFFIIRPVGRAGAAAQPCTAADDQSCTIQ